MSALSQSAQRMTEAEYLAFERASEFRHEYFAGAVFAMTGASEAHNLIAANVLVSLRNQLRGRSCRVYIADMRVKVAATGLYTYPDLSVVCGEARFADNKLDTLLNPAVIIEVLSPSTEAYDRGRKFQHYRQIETLREYLLIAQDSPRIERYLRRDDGAWLLTDAHGLDAALHLPAIGCALALAEVYEQVTFSPASPAGRDAKPPQLGG
ncbi:MAG: Uma2 family endonuclease [Aggregatilineales bacterium]